MKYNFLYKAIQTHTKHSDSNNISLYLIFIFFLNFMQKCLMTDYRAVLWTMDPTGNSDYQYTPVLNLAIISANQFHLKGL